MGIHIITEVDIFSKDKVEVSVFGSLALAKEYIRELFDTMREVDPECECPNLDGPLPIHIKAYPCDITLDVPIHIRMR